MLILPILAVTMSASVLCNNQNWEYSEECQSKPVLETMIINPFGVSSGELENGKKWTQTRITPYISEYRMEDVHWYVINGEIVYID